MVIQTLDPGYVKLYYTSNGHEHVAILPTRFPTSPTVGEEPYVHQNSADDDSVLLSAALADYATIWQLFYKATDSLNYAEAWKKPTPTADPQYIWTEPIGVNGTSTNANVPFGQLTITFRTVGGGIYKHTLMESVVGHTVRDVYPFASSAWKQLSDYLVGGEGWLIGRDDTKLIAPYRTTGNINKALRRRYSTYT